MYVYIEVALCKSAHGIGRPTGPGGGAYQKNGSNVPTPWVPSVPRHARWLILAHGVCFLWPTLLRAAKGDLFPHIGGAESHRARSNYNLPVAMLLDHMDHDLLLQVKPENKYSHIKL